ncbi:MAG: hypothetical protein PW792_01635 [Acidobacteriaceae bacterium]|nr:hypothetical protein [Acidobacteriaceae bacterium]
MSTTVQPNAEPQFSNVKIYILRVGSQPNGQATDITDCGSTNPMVGTDSNGECYVASDVNGNFDLTDAYYANCNADSDIIYFEIVGGEAGVYYNQNLALVAVPSSTQTCGWYYNNASTAFIVISDFTNVAAAFSAGTFASYTKSAAHLFDSISAYPADYTALGTAFDTANNLIPIASGFYGGSDSNVQRELNTLADVVAPCLNSTGATTAGTRCGDLFTQTTQGQFSTAHPPSTPFMALASMAQFPTNNVTNQFYEISATPPWQPNDSTAPSSWLIPVNGSLQPTISTSTAASATHNTTGFTITGTNFGSTSSLITVVGAGQKLPVTGVSGTTSITVSIPNHVTKGALGVYVNGVASAFTQFSIN